MQVEHAEKAEKVASLMLEVDRHIANEYVRVRCMVSVVRHVNAA
jgi:hypothetical protein